MLFTPTKLCRLTTGPRRWLSPRPPMYAAPASSSTTILSPGEWSRRPGLPISLSGSGSGSGPAKLGTPITDGSLVFPTQSNICQILISPYPTSRTPFMPKVSGFQFNRPQQLAALLLLLLLGQCLWVFHRQTLTSRDYDFARCGREMWEKPNPLAGYFTSCGNISGGRVMVGNTPSVRQHRRLYRPGLVLLLSSGDPRLHLPQQRNSYRF